MSSLARVALEFWKSFLEKLQKSLFLKIGTKFFAKIPTMHFPSDFPYSGDQK